MILHKTHLDELVNDPKIVDKNYKTINWISKEPNWYSMGTMNRRTMCDIIGAYNNGIGFAWELKSNRNKRHKALKQLKSSEMFLREVLNYEHVFKKFITYKNGVYRYENI